MRTRTFTELYCERERISQAAAPERLFRRTLYPHARLIAGVLRRVRRRHFRADFEFIEDVGYLRSLQDFALALSSYIEHPDNRSLLRRRLRIRISGRRMLQVVRGIFDADGIRQVGPVAGNDTFEPFPERPDDPATGKNAATPR